MRFTLFLCAFLFCCLQFTPSLKAQTKQALELENFETGERWEITKGKRLYIKLQNKKEAPLTSEYNSRYTPERYGRVKVMGFLPDDDNPALLLRGVGSSKTFVQPLSEIERIENQTRKQELGSKIIRIIYFSGGTGLIVTGVFLGPLFVVSGASLAAIGLLTLLRNRKSYRLNENSTARIIVLE